MKKINKLDARGFSHHFVLVAFVLIFAVAGVAYVVAGHAQSRKQKQHAQKSAQSRAAKPKAARSLPPDPQPATPQPITDGTGNDGAVATASWGGIPNYNPPKRGVDAAQIAQSQLGGGYESKYGGGSSSWCAGFATWTWRAAGSTIPHYLSAGDIAAWGKANKRFHTTKPRVGDIMVYGSIHAGVVVSSDSVNIKAVDGNWSGRVSYHQSGSDNGGPIKANYKDFYTSGQRVSGFVTPR